MYRASPQVKLAETLRQDGALAYARVLEKRGWRVRIAFNNAVNVFIVPASHWSFARLYGPTRMITARRATSPKVRALLEADRLL